MQKYNHLKAVVLKGIIIVAQYYTHVHEELCVPVVDMKQKLHYLTLMASSHPSDSSSRQRKSTVWHSDPTASCSPRPLQTHVAHTT